MGSPIEIELLATDAAGDPMIVDGLVRLINDAYSVGEAELWTAGTTRTSPDEVAELIRTGGMLTARVRRRSVGCACVRQVDPSTADLGFVSTDPLRWGGGVGRRLVDTAEELMRSRDASTMELKVLVPRDEVHPQTDRLRAWYSRRGYRIVRSVPFEEVATHAAAQLAKPCEFLIFRKPLAESTG